LTCHTENKPKKEKVVILGSGWAGYAFARTLSPAKYERVVISPRSYFVFTPLLASTSVGTLEFRAALEPVRRLGLDAFHQGWADDIDFGRKVIRVETNTRDELSSSTVVGNRPTGTGAGGVEKGEMVDVPYDKLIIAVGAYSQTFGIEGVKEHANFLRDIGDARKIRLRVLQLFEKAFCLTSTDADRRKLLHFAIVGGGPTGIEFAAELHDLVHDDLAKLYPELMPFVSITVYDIAPKVLPMFDRQLADYATDLFKRQHIEVKTEHHLERIRPDEDGSGALKLRIKEYGDEEVGAGIVVWSTGLMQNPLVQKLVAQTLQLPRDGEKGVDSREGVDIHILKDAKTGGIVTDAHLRVKLASPASSSEPPSITTTKTILPDVYAIGDCTTLEGAHLPATAQVASQQAVYLAKNLNKADRSDGPAAAPFKFRNWGTMAYLGSWRAIHQSSADEIKGRAAWILWRTAYLTKSMSVRNKIMVPVYWLMTWLFGRDISRF
jgi:NADH dehydrogenase FAD-containing subunit